MATVATPTVVVVATPSEPSVPTTSSTTSISLVDTSAIGFISNDVKLIERKDEMLSLHTKYSAIANDDDIHRTHRSLIERKFVVHLVNTKAEALKIAISLLPPVVTGSDVKPSFSSAGAQSLTDIGFTLWAKQQTNYVNYKGLAMAHAGTKDYLRYCLAGMTADTFFTTPSAVTHDGRLLWTSGTGMRVSLIAKQTIFIVGANKIVSTMDDALKRQEIYCKPLVGAMVRQRFNMPDTYSLETTILNGQSLFNPCQIVVILVRESLGY